MFIKRMESIIKTKNKERSVKRPLSQSTEETIQNLFEKKFVYKSSYDWDAIMNSEHSGICDETWQVEEYMEMKADMNCLKSSLNDKDLVQWHIHTKTVHHARMILPRLKPMYRPEFCTQAWLKFYEIASNYLQIDRNMPYFSVHLCEAPGAFITSLNHFLYSTGYRGTWRWLATTLNTYYEGNNIDEMIADDRLIRHTFDNWYFGVDGTGNIMSRNNMEGLKEMLTDIHVNLVTADGSVDCQKEPAEQENIVSWLHHCEALTALQILSPGGDFVLKMFTMLECESMSLMFLLNCLFTEVHVCKPCCSKGGNSEVYVVCKNYKGRQLCETFLDSLVPIYFSDKKPRGCLFRKSEIPEGFFEQHTKCVRYFQELQKVAIQRNLDLYGNHGDEVISQMQAEQDFCQKTFCEKYEIRHLPKCQKLLKCETGKEYFSSKTEQTDESWDVKYAKRIKLDGRLIGSLQKRQHENQLLWKQKVKVFETYEEETRNQNGFSCWLKNDKTAWNEIPLQDLEPVIGLKYTDIQSSRFSYLRLVGQVQEIIKNVEWLSSHIERDTSVKLLTLQNLKQTIETHCKISEDTVICDTVDGIQNDTTISKVTSDSMEGTENDTDVNTVICDSTGIMENDISTDIVNCECNSMGIRNDSSVSKGAKNGVEVIHEFQQKHIDRKSPAENGNFIERTKDGSHCVGNYTSCILDDSFTEFMSRSTRMSRVHRYCCISKTINPQFEVCDQLILLESVLNILKTCVPGDLVVMEMGSCLTRITAGLVYCLYQSFSQIGFLHHHGNYLRRHLVCVSYRSYPIELVDYLQTVYDVIKTDQSETVLEIIPIITLLEDEKFYEFLHTTNNHLLQSFITTVIHRERQIYSNEPFP